jgi:hypothetical protein
MACFVLCLDFAQRNAQPQYLVVSSGNKLPRKADAVPDWVRRDFLHQVANGSILAHEYDLVEKTRL